MNYKKTDWNTGDLITEELMDNIETGIDNLITEQTSLFSEDIELTTPSSAAYDHLVDGGINSSGKNENTWTNRTRIMFTDIQPGRTYLFSLNNDNYIIIRGCGYTGTSQDDYIRSFENNLDSHHFYFTADVNMRYFRVSFAAVSDATITAEDKTAILNSISLKAIPFHSNDIKSLNAAIGLVDYNNYRKEATTSGSGKFDVERDGIRVKVSGANTDTSAYRIRLTGNISRVQGEPTTAIKTAGYCTLKLGHEYLVTVRRISGTCSGRVYAAIYYAGDGAGVPENRDITGPDGTNYRYFTPTTMENVCIFLSLAAQCVAENAVFEVILMDVTDSAISELFLRQITPIEKNDVAIRYHKAGEYFAHKNNIVRANEIINGGDTISTATNIDKVTVLNMAENYGTTEDIELPVKVTWEQGGITNAGANYNGNADYQANTVRSSSFSLNYTGWVYFKPLVPNTMIRVYLWDADNNYVCFYGYKTNHVVFWSNPSYSYRVVIQASPSDSATNKIQSSMIHYFKVYYKNAHHVAGAPSEGKKRYRIMTHNVGQWKNGDGNYIKYDANDTYAPWENLHTAILERNAPDIACYQEYYPFGEVLSRYHKNIYEYFSTHKSKYNKKCIASNYPLYDCSGQEFETPHDANLYTNYTKAYVYLDGKKVCIFNTHLSWTKDNVGHTAENMRELKIAADNEVVNGCGYVIVCADFNTADYETYFKQWVDSGYTIANPVNDKNKWFPTSYGEKTTKDAGSHIDNIIVSSNIHIVNAYVDYQKWETAIIPEKVDHMPLIADIELEPINHDGDLVDVCREEMFEQHGIASGSGLNANVANYRCFRTISGIPRNTVSIKVKGDAYRFRLYLYGTDKFNDYLGAWDGTQLITDISETTLLTEMNNVQRLYEIYPRCRYIRMVLVRADKTDMELTDWNQVEIFVPKNQFSNKLYVALGDSITEGFIPRNYTGYGTDANGLQPYAALGAMSLGLTFTNMGLANSCVGDFGTASSVAPMITRYTSIPDNADYISVMGGANDIRKATFQLGTINDIDDASTYYGALHAIFGGLYKKFFIDPATPNYNVKIFGITPIRLLRTSASTAGGNGVLYDMEALATAMKEVCAYYGFPCLDMQHLCKLNPAFDQTIQGTTSGYTGLYNKYMPDGTHPTQEGQAMMADVLTGFMRSLQ